MSNWNRMILELRRAIGVTLLGWAQSIFPLKDETDAAFHRGVRLTCVAMMAASNKTA